MDLALDDGEASVRWRRAGSLTSHARPDGTGLGRSLPIKDPIEGVFITSSIVDPSNPTPPPVDQRVTGSEPRIPWP